MRRADAGETITDDNICDSETGQASYNDAGKEKIEALADMICRCGDEPEIKSAALLVLMSAIENSAHPKAVANAVKHAAFAQCGELNVYNLVESEVLRVERYLQMQHGAA